MKHNTAKVNWKHKHLKTAMLWVNRQLEVLELIVQGYSNAAIAKQLYITVGTRLDSRAKYLEQKNG